MAISIASELQYFLLKIQLIAVYVIIWSYQVKQPDHCIDGAGWCGQEGSVMAPSCCLTQWEICRVIRRHVAAKRYQQCGQQGTMNRNSCRDLYQECNAVMNNYKVSFIFVTSPSPPWTLIAANSWLLSEAWDKHFSWYYCSNYWFHLRGDCKVHGSCQCFSPQSWTGYLPHTAPSSWQESSETSWWGDRDKMKLGLVVAIKTDTQCLISTEGWDGDSFTAVAIRCASWGGVSGVKMLRVWVWAGLQQAPDIPPWWLIYICIPQPAQHWPDTLTHNTELHRSR